ncbi:3-methyladenine DNA glycosylase [Nocardia sp. NBC_00416]|uniref:3-methyladenine DNA glycosylase n=1 Tax=Nocardia sp. NBC_00416 TaxID=2975991 RepID=UPI002E1B4CC3
MTAADTRSVLAGSEWRARAAAHRDRVDTLAGPYLRARAAGAKHPVLDFLFTYYGHKPAQLRRWHPGFGIALTGAADYVGLRGYHRIDRAGAESGPAVTADPEFLRARADTVTYIVRLLRATANRPAQLSCFGLHEWAMVYRTGALRHDSVPLRLGAAGTDAVFESMPVRCTHFDAFRFFAPDAVGRNNRQLTRDDQIRTEQPGCLHANMDLYKWNFKLSPLIGSDLLLDCFALARDARELDMRASPYDLRTQGYDPICIETPSGRAEYVRRQSEVADRAAILRSRLLDACEGLLAQLPA